MNFPTSLSLHSLFPLSMIGRPDAPSVQLASTANSTTTTAHISRNATATMENVPVLLDMEVTIVRYLCVARWLMATTGRSVIQIPANAKTAGRESTATSVKPTMPVML